jgi:trehalose 6-phosphate phosphatase
MHPVLDALSADPRHALLAVDFDGTLSHIVDDPSRARPADGTIRALTALAVAGVQVAVVTGRDAETVLALGGLTDIPQLVVSGLHGAQTWRDGVLQSAPEPAGIQSLRAALPSVLQEVDPAVWLEDKLLSLVVHTRPAGDPEAALESLRRPVSALAHQHGLDVVAGKNVLEIRIPSLSKADALQSLLDPQVTNAVYAGDDLGDLPAMAALRDWSTGTGRHGLAIAVGDLAEVTQAADLVCADPDELAELLSALARQSQVSPS